MVNSRTRSRPDLGRGSSRSLVWSWYQICGGSREELRATDAVQLLADDLDDRGPDPHRQRQQRVVAGHELAHVDGPEQQAVAGGVGTAGVLPEGWYKELCPAHRACDLASSVGACHRPAATHVE